MWQADPDRLAAEISHHFGLHFEGVAGRTEAGEHCIDLSPAGIHPNESFRIRLDLGWRSLQCLFLAGPFAGYLIAEMGNAGPEGRAEFARVAEKCGAENARIRMVVNGVEAPALASSSWPQEWHSLELGLLKTPLAIHTEDHSENDLQLSLWARRFTGLVVSLLPLEEVEEIAEVNPEGLPEGGGVRILVNRYERSYANRIRCLEIHGYSCLACGFNFEQVYGPVGEGFVHVHHVTPVSELGPGYIVNPRTDLVPLCANCHAMAHRTSPPLTVDELRKILAVRNSSRV